MIITVHRHHNAQPVKFEQIGISATIQIDTEVDTEYADMTDKEISADLEERLDTLLDKPAQRVVALQTNEIEDSHLWDYYEID